MKLTYVASRIGDDKAHVSQTVTLSRNNALSTGQEVLQIELYRTPEEVRAWMCGHELGQMIVMFVPQAFVYINTVEGIYSIPVSDCSIYSGCRYVHKPTQTRIDASTTLGSLKFCVFCIAISKYYMLYIWAYAEIGLEWVQPN